MTRADRPQSDSKLTQKWLQTPCSSHIGVAFESLGVLWGGTPKVTFEVLSHFWVTLIFSVYLGERPLHNPRIAGEVFCGYDSFFLILSISQGLYHKKAFLNPPQAEVEKFLLPFCTHNVEILELESAALPETVMGEAGRGQPLIHPKPDNHLRCQYPHCCSNVWSSSCGQPHYTPARKDYSHKFWFSE